jgi:choline dehydrogenase-like flavoprotein
VSGGFVSASNEAGHLDEADVVIVGSGAGGGAAAQLLSRGGLRVVVLEEGPYVPRGVDLTQRDAMPRLFRRQGKMAAFGRATTPILQGRAVGGTTFVNSAIVWRLPDKVLAEWHRDPGLQEGLPASQLEEAHAFVEGALSERPVVRGETAGLSDLLLERGAAALGVEGRFIHRFERGCRGSGRCLYGCPSAAKQSTTVTSLADAVAHGAVVVSDARVERVHLRRGRAEAVSVVAEGQGRSAGARFEVRARRAVIVAASAIGSPNLLARSGLRSSALGRRFMAHPGTTVMGLYPHAVHMWSGASQGYEVMGYRDTTGVKLESINVPPEVVWARLPGAGARFGAWLERLTHVAAWAVALRAETVGRVRPSWLLGDRVDYDLSDEDVRRLRDGMRHLAALHFAAGAEQVIPGVAGLPEVLTSADQLALFDEAPLDPRSYSLVATHLFGGCVAGSDPARSVVDPHLRVHGTEGLYVMDASVFPSNTGVNPQHSIMAVARVAAARLLDASLGAP